MAQMYTTLFHEGMSLAVYGPRCPHDSRHGHVDEYVLCSTAWRFVSCGSPFRKSNATGTFICGLFHSKSVFPLLLGIEELFYWFSLSPTIWNDSYGRDGRILHHES